MGLNEVFFIFSPFFGEGEGEGGEGEIFITIIHPFAKMKTAISRILQQTGGYLA